MKINIYYLIVGILSVLFAITHALNGQGAILKPVGLTGLDHSIKTTLFYIWHIITAENLIFGIAFMMMAFRKNQSKITFAAWLIAAIIIARWCVIFGSTWIKDRNGLADTWIDSIAIMIFVGLIVLGTRRANVISPDLQPKTGQ